MAHLTGPVGYPTQTSETLGTSDPKLALGTRARDASGNEYVYVDFQAAAVVGEVFAISSTFTATDVTTSTVGPVGIVVASAVTSDSCGWLQIYGSGSALGSSLLIIGAVGLGDTSDGISYLLPYSTTLTQVQGIYVTVGSSGASAVSSADWTSATLSSQMGGLVTVALNYPFIAGGVSAVESS